MSVTTTLHVNLRGNAREALEFYQSVFGGDLVAVPYGDVAAGQDDDQSAEIAWGQVSSPSGFRVMAYDVQRAFPWDAGRNAFYHALRGDDADEVTTYWNGLADGATIHDALGPAAFSPLYGKLTDRFGVTWIVDVVA